MTEKKLPSELKTIFMVCEDIRAEGGNKFSLLGILGDRFNIPDQQDPTLPSMTFFFAFTDGVGQFNASQEVLDPNGKVILAPTDKEPSTKPADGWMVFAFKIVPFKPIPGTYRVSVTLDDERYERMFTVQRVHSATKAAAQLSSASGAV